MEQKVYDVVDAGEVWVHGVCLETEAGQTLIKALEKLEQLE